jgi:hypothetical protein
MREQVYAGTDFNASGTEPGDSGEAEGERLIRFFEPEAKGYAVRFVE